MYVFIISPIKTNLRYVVVVILSSQPWLRHNLNQTQLSLILEFSEANTDSILIHPKQEIFNSLIGACLEFN